MFPDKLLLGMEIRVKVSEYVRERIAALRVYVLWVIIAFRLLNTIAWKQPAPRLLPECERDANECNEVSAESLHKGAGWFSFC